MEIEGVTKFTHQGIDFRWNHGRQAWAAPLDKMAPFAHLYIRVPRPHNTPLPLMCNLGVGYGNLAPELGVEAAEYLATEARVYIQQAYDVIATPRMFKPIGLEVPWDPLQQQPTVLLRGEFDIDTVWIVRMRGTTMVTWRVDHSESRTPRRKTTYPL